MTTNNNLDIFLKATLKNNSYYNILMLPFDYIDFIQKEVILEQLDKLKHASDNDLSKEKDELQTILYTEIYKLNLTVEQAQEYIQKAILTDRFKNYLGVSFKYAIQYNKNENPFISTFIHLAQMLMADVCYEYLWRVEHKRV